MLDAYPCFKSINPRASQADRHIGPLGAISRAVRSGEGEATASAARFIIRLEARYCAAAPNVKTSLEGENVH
jgi:hypothetical protein